MPWYIAMKSKTSAKHLSSDGLTKKGGGSRCQKNWKSRFRVPNFFDLKKSDL